MSNTGQRLNARSFQSAPHSTSSCPNQWFLTTGPQPRDPQKTKTKDHFLSQQSLPLLWAPTLNPALTHMCGETRWTPPPKLGQEAGTEQTCLCSSESMERGQVGVVKENMCGRSEVTHKMDPAGSW